MSGLSVLKVLATVVDLFKMFNSTIGTFHHTTDPALQRSSLAGLRLLSIEPVSNLEVTVLRKGFFQSSINTNHLEFL